MVNINIVKEAALNEENEIVERLKKENVAFRRLEEGHKKLENTLSELDRKVHLTAEEEAERKRIQKLKLAKKDQMAEVIREYKKGRSN